MASLKTGYIHSTDMYVCIYMCMSVYTCVYICKCTHMYRNADVIHLFEIFTASINMNVLLNLAALYIFVGVYFCKIKS